MPMFEAGLPIDADVHSIIAAAGGAPWGNRYDHETATWWLDAPSQEALDAAVAAYDHTAFVMISQRQRKLTDLAARRYEVETAGITVNGETIRTDRESQAMIAGAYAAARDGVIAVFDFKSPAGWALLSAAEVIAIGQAVAQRVQACFTRERELAEAIAAAADAEALDAIDLTIGWPA